MLTYRQATALEFIRQYQAFNSGVSPTFTEIMEHLGINSRSGVYRLLCGLEVRGFIRRLPGKARAIEVIRDF